MTDWPSTQHRLTFSHVPPDRFEDLTADVLTREFPADALHLEHIGRSGTDGGVDIRGTDAQGRTWLVQCKRHAKTGPTNASKWAAGLLADGAPPGCVAVLVVSSAASRATRDAFAAEAAALGAGTALVLDCSDLERVLFLPGEPSLLAKYFGFADLARHRLQLGATLLPDEPIPVVVLTPESIAERCARERERRTPTTRAWQGPIEQLARPSSEELELYLDELAGAAPQDALSSLAGAGRVVRVALDNLTDYAVSAVRIRIELPPGWYAAGADGAIETPEPPGTIGLFGLRDHRRNKVVALIESGRTVLVLPDQDLRPHERVESVPIVIMCGGRDGTTTLAYRMTARDRDGVLDGTLTVRLAGQEETLQALHEAHMGAIRKRCGLVEEKAPETRVTGGISVSRLRELLANRDGDVRGFADAVDPAAEARDVEPEP